jgi:Cellulase (glycosyl hydrolase family 5)
LLLASLAQPARAASSGDGQRLLGPGGVPLFIVGMNYEGPADRAWQMWDNGKFDANLIEADFQRAREQAGANVLRIFVQASLATDIAAGKWDKLDAVVDLAEKHKLQLIVSLHDYGERDLSKVSKVAGQVARRYRNRSGILAFDLKNEPRFGDLALTIYASPVALQQRQLIDTFGEQLPRDQLTDYRASDDGVKDVPSYLSDDEAWVYVNNLRLYRAMLADAATWARGHGGTTLDYLDDAAGNKWAPLIGALDQSLQAWIQPQLEAIRAADPTRPVTVDHVDMVLARQPANNALDFESLHRYPSTSGASIRANLNLLTSVERTHPNKPVVLSEFGFATDSVDADKASLNEVAIQLGLLSEHAAGGVKWMLNDMPPGFNQRERTLGAFRVDGSAKPVAGALAALRKYLDATGSQPGSLKLETDPDAGARYVYRADDALLLGGKKVDGGAASFEASGPAQLFLTWTGPGVVNVWASAPMQATVDLGQLLGGSATREVRKLNVPAGFSTIQIVGSSPRSAADYDTPNGHFFTQTNANGSTSGFAVTNESGVPLWTGFKALGGVDVLGYPVTRRFEMDGFVVQAFQKSVLQWRPEQKSFAFLNTFDVMHDRGLDNWLSVYRQTPPPLDSAADKGLPFDGVMARHLALLDGVPRPLKEAFLADPGWLDHYGLPVATQDTDNNVVVRAQRASLQYWKVAVPWAAQGTVSVANGGDLAKEAGVFPWQAVTPENAPR